MKKKLIMLLFGVISIFIFNANVKAGIVKIGYMHQEASIQTNTSIGTVTFNLYDGQTCDSTSRFIGKYSVNAFKTYLNAYNNSKNINASNFSSGYACVETLSVPEKFLVPEAKTKSISLSTSINQELIISLKNKTVDYKITYKYRDEEDHQFKNVPGVLYKLMDGSCNSNVVLHSGITSEDGTFTFSSDDEIICLKSTLPKGFDYETTADDYKILHYDDREDIIYLVQDPNDKSDDIGEYNTYKIGYKSGDSYIEGIEYSIYKVTDSVMANTFIETRTSSSTGFTDVILENSSIRIKTNLSTIPSGYQLTNSEDAEKVLTTTDNVAEISLSKVDDKDDGSDEPVTEYTYKIIYRVADGEKEAIIGNVGYEIYNVTSSGTCGTTRLKTGTSNNTDYSSETIDASSICLKTTSYPSGYSLYNETDVIKILTPKTEPEEIMLKYTKNDSGSSTQPDDDNDNDNDNDIFTYKISYEDISTSQLVGNVEYSIYPTKSSSGICAGISIKSNELSGEEAKFYSINDNAICVSTTKLPEGYELHNEEQLHLELTGDNEYIAKILLTSSKNSEENPGSNDNDAASGNINVMILDKGDKIISGVKYKLCHDAECKNVKYEGTNITHTNVPLGTYYIMVSSVPEKYTLPQKVYNVVLTKDRVDEEVKVVLEEKISVPNTALNASKLFTISGIIGIIGGVSLLYLNSKKQKIA